MYLFQKTLHDVSCSKRRKQLLRRTLRSLGVRVYKRNSSIELKLFQLFNSHYYSYDKSIRANEHHSLTPLSEHDALDEFTSHDFYHASSFWPDQFHEIIDAMELMPNKIVNEKHGHFCDKKVSFFIMLRSCYKPDAWEDTKLVLRKQRTWNVHIHHDLFHFLTSLGIMRLSYVLLSFGSRYLASIE